MAQLCGAGPRGVHVRPRRSEREGLHSRGKFFVGSVPQAIMRCGATRGHAGPARVPRVPRGSHAGPTRVPRGSLAGFSRVHFTLRGPHAPFGFLKFY